MKKKVLVSVINDLVSDQRVHRTCLTLHEMGLEVCLIGRKLPNSLPITNRPYKTHRMKLMFSKGALFYAEYNFRLFLYLLFHRYSILHSNDLDTLLANYMCKRIKGGDLVYDSHEYFCEVPELIKRPKVQSTWRKIEKMIFPKLKNVFTVNQSISNIYQKEYNVPVKILRNVPITINTEGREITTSKKALGLPADKKIILLQGAGINVDRGAEEMVDAMQWIDAVFLIVGTGDVIEELKEKVTKNNLQEKVVFTGKVPFQKLVEYTEIADVGVTLDKDTNLNYRYSLPNKLFDYIHSGLPVIASNLVEVKRIISEYKVGLVLSSHNPQKMAEEINDFFQNENLFLQSQSNTQVAKSQLNWEKEKEVLIAEYKQILD